MSVDVVFAYVVGVLAGLAVIGALAFALVWEGAPSGGPWPPTATKRLTGSGVSAARCCRSARRKASRSVRAAAR